MSLEQTIADLVAASNNLTGTINSKMNEIDQKVDEATASVPDAVRKLSNQSFFVDQVSGNDANDGSANSPIRSVNEAVRRTPSMAKCEAILLNDYNFDYEVETGSDLFVLSRPGDPSRRITFATYAFEASNAEILLATRGIVPLSNNKITFRNVNIEMPGLSDAPAHDRIDSARVGCIRTNLAQENATTTAILIDCAISRPADNIGSFITSGYTLNLTQRSTSILGESMNGHWWHILKDEAGTDPATVGNLVMTNLTTI